MFEFLLPRLDFEGQAYEVVKAFYPDVVHLQFQMEECHKILTDQVDWANPEGDQVRMNVSKPLPFSGPPVRTHMRIVSVVSIKAFFRYGYDYLKEITLRRADYQEYMIAEKDCLYPSDFEDLNMLLLQGHLNHLSSSDKQQLNLTKPGWDAKGFEFKHDYTIIEMPRAVVFPVSNNERKIMRFNEIYKFSDDTLTNIMEALDYRVKEYKVNRLNPGWIVMVLIEPWIWVEHWGSSVGVSIMKLTTGRLIDGSSCGGIASHKNLDLEPKIDAMMRDFLDPSRWKEMSKETSSKILPCGDRSCWKTFKPIVSLIAKRKLK
uniref:Uncharacterized protein n=1 Tax=Tanacetum cinerariifolium TaxID=118510 RepID=A0A6L2M6Y8_TANCI|nr:hypothetical protein [Tanacetum cinerariifolium]